MTLTTGQVTRLLILLGVFALVLVACATALRIKDHRPPAAVSQSAFAEAFGLTVATEPAQGAGPSHGLKIVLGGGGFYTHDPSALNKSVGEPVVLRTREAALRVTAVRVTAGTASCAAGPLVTVDLLVEPSSGQVELPLDDFRVMAADGSAAGPVQACVTGFAEGAAKRTLVFAATEPDRLLFGTDPADPVAVWHLA